VTLPVEISDAELVICDRIDQALDEDNIDEAVRLAKELGIAPSGHEVLMALQELAATN
jgi:hypothetical protein